MKSADRFFIEVTNTLARCESKIDERITEVQAIDLLSQAFSEHLNCEHKEQPTLRDRFAMAALTGLMANSEYRDCTTTHEEDARECYQLADAMLLARSDKEK